MCVPDETGLFPGCSNGAAQMRARRERQTGKYHKNAAIGKERRKTWIRK